MCESWLVSLETRSQNASEETGFHKRSGRPCQNTSATRRRRRRRCFCLRGGVKMSALQSVMSQLVISIRCNCITPAAESDSKKGGRRANVGSLPAHWHRRKRAHEQDVYALLSAWCIFLSITMPLLIIWRTIPFAALTLYLSLNENHKPFEKNQTKQRSKTWFLILLFQIFESNSASFHNARLSPHLLESNLNPFLL